jgi:hypothetical protein
MRKLKIPAAVWPVHAPGGIKQRDSLEEIQKRLPRRFRSCAVTCPQTGSGVHNFVLERVRHLSDYLEPEKIHDVIRLETADCGRDVPDAEIWRAIQSWAIRIKGESTKLVNPPCAKLAAGSRELPWPERDYQLIDELVRAGAGAEALLRTSPWTIGEGGLAPDKVVRWMFSGTLQGTDPEGDPLVCAGPKTDFMRTNRLSQWGHSFRNQTFIVPNPMSKVQGINQKGKLSWRCLDNTGERWYLVIDCDIRKSGSDEPGSWNALLEAWAEKGITIADANAAILWKLSEWLPLVLVVYSGGTSDHGWFSFRGVDEREMRKFMRNAVVLGADHVTWTRCQPVRMPEGIRWEDKSPPVRQRVLYFDPWTIQKWRGGLQ